MRVIAPLLLASMCLTVDAFTNVGYTVERRSTIVEMARRGKSSFRKVKQERLNSGASGMGSATAGKRAAKANSFSNQGWLEIPGNPKQLLEMEEGKLELIDTNLEPLIDNLTNPKGTVAVTKYEGETYCFSVACPSCKIPVTKSKVLSPLEDSSSDSARLACDFCKVAYDLKSGKKTDATDIENESGILGGVVKNFFSAQASNSGPLSVYQLGEKNGKLLINL